MKPIALLTLCAGLCLQQTAKAQVAGIGRGNMIPFTQDVSRPPLYTDNKAAAVTSIVRTSPTASSYKITVATPAIAALFVPDPSCGATSNGDMVLVIQMKGTRVGQHQNGYVTNVSGNTLTVCAVDPTVMLPFSTGTGDMVQIIKINEYSNLTLTGGTITCHPWNEAQGTGGVLCFMVNGSFKITGGVINAAGKGFGPYKAPVWGRGGAGASGATTITPSGYPAPTDVFVGCVYKTVATGTDGGAANNTWGPGIGNIPATPTSYNPGTPFFYTKAVMGQAGYYPSGYGGGNGAGGGGKGGDGAGSCVSLSGATGNDGEAGGDGGDPGRGAAGGGIIIIKANFIDGTAADPNARYFNASGGNGDAGRPGGNGGQGGEGGVGAEGMCNVCDPGGPGGKGMSGDPGNGGDGSNGAGAGTIWVAGYDIKGRLNANNLMVNAGAPGLGGPGGWSWASLPVMAYPDPCKDTPCTTTPPHIPGTPCTGMQVKEICDKYTSFCMLANYATASAHHPGDNGIGSGYDFSNGGTDKVVYDDVNNELTGIVFDDDHCIEWHYKVTLYSPDDCNRIFRKLAYMVTGENSPTNQIVDLKTTDHAGSCKRLPAPPTVTFNDAFKHSMFVFHGDLGYIEDLTEPGYPRCYIGACMPNDIPGLTDVRQGEPGRPGTAPEHGTKQEVIATPSNPTATPPDPTANAILQDLDGGFRWKQPASVNELQEDAGMTLYPQPAGNKATLTLTEAYTGTVRLRIYDLSGKLIKDWEDRLPMGRHELNIPLTSFRAGTYLLKITDQEQRSAAIKLVVE